MADIPVKYYKAVIRSEKFKPNNPQDLENPPEVINPIGSMPTTLYKLLGDVTDSDFIGKNGRVPVVNDENVLTLEPLPQLQENGLISGGIVQWTGIGYIFNVSGAFYRIGGVYYESPPIQITLATPDVTNNRIDVFAVDINGVALAITGTPSGSPVKPQIDPQTQLELTSVIVTASTTVPVLTTEVIYDQNIEWTGSSTGTGTVAFNSAVNPFQGSLSIEATNIQNGLKIRLTDGSDYDLSTVQTLGLQINLKATMGAGINIGVTFLNSSGNPISTELILSHDKSLLGYQFVGIALSQFSFTSFLARSIEFRYIRTKGTIIYSGFFLDIIKLEGGINPPMGVSSFLALSDTPSTYSGQAGKTVAVKADESGLEFVTGGGGASTFITLTDTPSTYVAQANKFPRVNGGETALVFDTVSPYDLDQEAATDGQVLAWSSANSRYQPTPGGGSIDQDNKIRVIEIPSSELPANPSEQDIVDWLNTEGLTISDKEIIGIEIITVPVNGLLVYYKLDEESGTILYDSQSTNDATLVGGTLNQVGKIENAVLFNGTSSQNFSVSGIVLGNQASVNLWVKLPAHTPSVSSKTGLMELNTADFATHYPFTDGNIYTSILTSVRKNIGVGIVADRTVWHMVTVTANVDTNVYKFYQNATLVFTGTVGTMPELATMVFAKSKGAFYFDGTMDEVGIWERELNAAEITQLYNGGNGVTL